MHTDQYKWMELSHYNLAIMKARLSYFVEFDKKY
jgi:hypothetical protein